MKKKIKIGIFLVLILVLAQILTLEFQKSKDSEAVESTDYRIVNDGNVGQIKKGVYVSQTFQADKDFQGVSLLMGTYGKVTNSKLQVRLIDEETGEELCSKQYSIASMKDNSYYSFMFDDEVKVTEPHEYRIEVTSNAGILGSTATIWSASEDKYPDGKLYINEEEKSGDLVFNIVYEGKESIDIGMFLHRASLMVLLFAFLGLHCFLDIPKMYQWIFKKRVWIAIGVFVFLVANKYNFSSIGQFDIYVQTGEGSEYVTPVFGKARSIRSDEWMVSTPRMISAEYSDYGKYNDCTRGTTTTNLTASGLYLNYSALAKPAEWGFYLLGSEYGISFLWCFKMIFGFLFSYELCLIITKRKPLLALMGAGLIWFSSFNMWWSMVNWIFAGEAAIVCLYYYLQEKTRWKRILWGIAIALFGANFVVELYPAWQVPAGYIFLILLIWMFIEKREVLKNYKWKDWLIAVGCIAFMVSVIGVYLMNYSEYLEAINNTVYPGKRVSYGGNAWGHLLGYIPTLLMPMAEYTNPSEAGCFFSLFPLPYVVAIVMFVRNRKKDLLTGLLLAATTVLTVYCTVALPAGIAKVLLLTYSTPMRAADIVGYAQILLMMIVLGRYEVESRFKVVTAAILSTCSVGAALVYAKRQFAGYTEFIYFVLIAAAVVIGITILISKNQKKLQNAIMICVTLLMVVTGGMVNPLMCGIDAITSKPAAKEVRKIVENDREGKWLAADSAVNGNFLVACGASAINSVNYIPNMELWEILDPEGELEEYYNRYAHINFVISPDEFKVELKQGDFLEVYIPYEYLQKMDVKYIFRIYPYDEEEEQGYGLEEIYAESGTYIYKVE